MKSSGAPEVGDLVVSLIDEARNIKCIGLVMDSRGVECKVLWGSPSSPVGWWNRTALRVICESR